MNVLLHGQDRHLTQDRIDAGTATDVYGSSSDDVLAYAYAMNSFTTRPAWKSLLDVAVLPPLAEVKRSLNLAAGIAKWMNSL